MLKFLLNANLSSLTKNFLEKTFGYDVKTVQEAGLGSASDSEITAFARKEKRIIITLDLDFGELYFLSASQDLGVIVLRLENQTVEAVNKVLHEFFKKGVIEKHVDALIIVNEKRYRIRMRNVAK